MGTMRYKPLDKVRIKSLDWYNKNKDDNHEIKFENGIFTTLKSTFLGQIMTIELITLEKQYILMEDKYKTLWTDEMIEGLAEEETKPNIIEEAKTYWDSIKDAWICPEGYIFKDENGNVINATKIVLEKKKKEYPKTYAECCNILGYDDKETYCVCHIYANERLFESLYRLKICRDAYWKIAGDEMGLGKPWSPDLTDNVNKHCIEFRDCGVCKVTYSYTSRIFAFPTKEMRDAFKENFGPDIEICKELL